MSNPGITRRDLLAAAGAGIALLETGRLLRVSEVLAATTPMQPLTGPFPRAFAFRQAEVLANLRSYQDWEPLFLPLGGVAGKLLPEERTDTVSTRNRDYFARFKSRHSTKMALLHFNGVGRLPEFETNGWWPGLWLYRVGSDLTSSVDSSSATLSVSDPSRFTLSQDAFGDSWADLAITSVGADGLPDFLQFEYVRLTAIDATAGELNVIRGQYGSSPEGFDAGAYVVPIVTQGPYYRGGNKIWLYNFATTAPRDPGDGTVIDAILGGLAPRFAPGGELAFLDGIELDVFILQAALRGGIDADLDTVEDGGIADDVDVYELGMLEFARRLRDTLGPDRLLLTDGQEGQRPPASVVNGIEEEGFPRINDYNFTRWSEALHYLEFWKRNGVSPRLRYPMYKFRAPHDNPVSFARFRLALAASLLTGSAFTFYDEPGGGSLLGLAAGPNSGIFPNRFTIWDELVAGQAGTPRWIGRPSALAVHVAESGSDLLDGAGDTISPAFISGFAGTNVTFTRRATSPPSLMIKTTAGQAEMGFTWTGIDAPSGDAVLAFDVYAQQRSDYPGTVPRQLQVTASSARIPLGRSMIVLALNKWFHVAFALRGLGPGAVNFSFSIDGPEALYIRAVRAFDGPDAMYQLYENGAVFANPSGLVPHTYDLAGTFPGITFRRINGTPDQDPATNDGSLLDATLTLGPLDALLVRRS